MYGYSAYVSVRKWCSAVLLTVNRNIEMFILLFEEEKNIYTFYYSTVEFLFWFIKNSKN